MAWSALVDLAMTPEEQEDAGMVAAEKSDGPRYPFGMSLSFDKATLDKLGLSGDCNIGDLLDARIFAVVTAISKNQRNDGTDNMSVSVQIQKMSVENEMTE